jgi:hypothetical protein
MSTQKPELSYCETIALLAIPYIGAGCAIILGDTLGWEKICGLLGICTLWTVFAGLVLNTIPKIIRAISQSRDKNGKCP